MLNHSKITPLWEFIRGDLSSAEFEQWLYASKDVENVLGNQLYLELIATDFNNASTVYLIKKKLEIFLRKENQLACECLALSNDAALDMGSEKSERILSTLTTVKAYGEPRWWLSLNQCNKCNQYWLMAEESENYDIYFFKRLDSSLASSIIQDNKWPNDFQSYQELIVTDKNKL